MAKILNPLDVITVNVAPGATVDAEEGWALNLSSGALASTSASTVPVGLTMIKVADGAPAYGQSTGSEAECAIGRVLVRVTSADVNSASDFNTTNYGIGDSVGFTSGKFDYNATSKRGVVVETVAQSGSPEVLDYVVVLIDKVLG
jgi:hypothetical protein